MRKFDSRHHYPMKVGAYVKIKRWTLFGVTQGISTAAAACESRTAKEQNRTVPQGPPAPLMARPMSETYLPVAYRAVRTRAVEKSVTGARSSLPTTVNGRCSRRRATGGPRQPSLRAKTWQAVTAYSCRLTGVLFHCTTTTTTPVQRPRFQDNLGKPVPERQKQFGFK